MGKISFRISDTEELALKKKAESLGVTMSAYMRTMMLDSLQKDQAEEKHRDILFAIESLISVLGEAFGRTQGASDDSIERLITALKKRYERERLNKSSKYV